MGAAVSGPRALLVLLIILVAAVGLYFAIDAATGGPPRAPAPASTTAPPR